MSHAHFDMYTHSLVCKSRYRLHQINMSPATHREIQIHTHLTERQKHKHTCTLFTHTHTHILAASLIERVLKTNGHVHNIQTAIVTLRHDHSHIKSSILYLTGTRKKEEDALYDKVDRDTDKEDEESLTAHEKILIGRKRLPIFAYREEFLEAVRDNKIIVVVGETGSGERDSILGCGVIPNEGYPVLIFLCTLLYKYDLI